MWRLWHWLFGWDYIYWENTVSQGIARLYRSPNGELYYFRYKNTNCIDRVTTEHQCLWLTCESIKYLK